MGSQTRPTRRELRFATTEDLLQELDRIEAASQTGRLITTGAWTAGQNLSHVAAWINYAYDGFPVKAPPFFVRWVMRRMLPRLLRDGMKPGVRIPGVKGGTTGADDVNTQEGLRRLRQAVQRLKGSEPALYSSPAFGPMSDEDRIQLMLRHAELHLGFLSYT